MALVALTTRDITAPRRVEGHTSNVVNPIYHEQLATIVSGDLAAGASVVIPHSITQVKHINITPLTAAGAESLYGAASGAATLGAYVDKNGYAVNWEVVAAAAVAGATTITLGASASAVNDVYNGCTLDIQLSDSVQTVKILDYVGATAVATIDAALEEALTTANLYRVRGSVLVSPTAATAPQYSVQVIGTLD